MKKAFTKTDGFTGDVAESEDRADVALLVPKSLALAMGSSFMWEHRMILAAVVGLLPAVASGV